MKNSTPIRLIWQTAQTLPGTLHWPAVVSLLVLPILGVIPDGYGGWVVCPPPIYAQASLRPACRHLPPWGRLCWQAAWAYARHSYPRLG